jgi:hypothetical protein
MKLYKIRHCVSGRWSKGGTYANSTGTNSSWTDKEVNAKTWNTLGKLRGHITSHLPKYKGDRCTDMKDWEVVTYNLVSEDIQPVHKIIDPKKLIDLLKT